MIKIANVIHMIYYSSIYFRRHNKIIPRARNMHFITC